ncbi:DTW domain-containing protein YfiP [Rhodoferax ferrireducens]|uniref:tRNA-uridine aminocarboxypropyltransferase n=1 Tax=Rhodoferax ferrireducens TaxID=192843 RepID=A0ABU2CGB2_9BURK|nr:tRNA-uridine aminocarboxypropyltransferase [Rhodoferax ferrireducens]MDR7380362.1 DTW domain-containing protein YfiP [Rhodoferax ferrireducens]
MSDAATVPRLRCARCLRAQRSCICQWIRPIAHQVGVLILQHPLEVYNAKGSARLLHLSLPNSRLLVGETFTEADVRVSAGRLVLLYPDTPQDVALGLPAAPALPQDWLQDPARLCLVVLDGTWRKSRKLLFQNPLLQQLPRLALRDMPPSQYRIRKAHKPDQLSTLEACCAALAQLEVGEGDAARYQPLLDAFDGFVDQQQAYRPG